MGAGSERIEAALATLLPEARVARMDSDTMLRREDYEDVLERFGKGTIDVAGRKRHDAYLFEVKKPSESKYPGDFYTQKAKIPAAEAFRNAKDSGCSLVGS